MKTQLKADEKIILTTRPHWFSMIIPAVITIAGFIAGLYIGDFGIILMLILICYMLYKIAERNNNIWIVTSLRVIDEIGVFSHDSKESPLDKINNVSYSQSFWGKIFGYGDIQIQTAAETGSTSYYNVSRPKLLKDTITQMQEEYKNNQIKRQATELANAIASERGKNKNDLASDLEKLHELKLKGILTEEEYINQKARILNR